ncbi:MAG: DUF3857 domain-containing protein [Planctomycetes bacterium]|nr:DUF3857 domain-containing protein [Planctomycetota bacterium]
MRAHSRTTLSPLASFAATAAALLAAVAGLLAAPPARAAESGMDRVTAIEDQVIAASAHGDVEKALDLTNRALVAGIIAARSAQSAEERAYALAVTTGFLHDHEGRVYLLSRFADSAAFLERLLPRIDDPPLAAATRMVMADDYRHLGREADARAQYDRLGFLRRWAVIGAFDNERGAGFDREYPPETEVDFGKSCMGKKWNVSWRACPVEPADGFVNLDALVRPNDQALAYAVTHVQSPERQAADLFIASDESIRIWVNGVKVFENNVKRGCGFDSEVARVTLEAGWNRILVKVGEEEGSWGFRLRLTAAGGGPFEGLAIDHGLGRSEPITPAAPGEPVESDAPPTRTPAAVLEAALKRNPADHRTAYRLAGLYVSEGQLDHASRRVIELTRLAVDAQPDSAPYHFALAQAAQLATSMAAERDQNLRRHELEKTIELDPKHVRARMALVGYYLDLGNAKRAREMLGDVLAIAPDNEGAVIADAHMKRARGWEVEEMRLVRQYAAAHPERLSVLRTYARALEQRGRNGEALDLIRKIAAADHLDRGARETLYRQEVLAGNMEAAMGHLDRLIAEDPFDLGAYSRKARVEEGDKSEAGVRAAVETLDRALAIAPEDDDLLREMGNLQHRLPGEEEKRRAHVYWMRSLDVNPKQPQLKEYIRFLKGKEPGFEAPFMPDAEPLITRAREMTHSDDDPYVVVLDLEITRVNVEGTTESYNRRILKVTAEAGKRQLDTVGVWGSRMGGEEVRIEKARLIRKNGKEEEVRIRWGGVDPPPLEIGDLIDFEFRRTETSQSFFGDYFGETVTFGGPRPVMEMRRVYLFPEGRKFHVHQTKGVPDPRVTRDEKSGATIHEWVARDLPKVEGEPMMPDAREVLPRLDISSYGTWPEFSEWYYNLVKRQHDSSEEMRAKVKELTAGLTDEWDKVRAIYNFVVTDIRYVAWEFGVHGYKPYQAATIFSRKFGDCKDKAILINAMLKEIGVKGEMVLINGDPQRSKEDLALPLIGHFNHCITRVTLSDGRTLFLDGTASFHGATDLPDFDKGATVLVVGEKAGRLETVPWIRPEENASRREARVTIAADGAATLAAKAHEVGARAAGIRQAFEVEEKRKTQVEESLSNSYGGAKVQEVKVSDLANLNAPVDWEYAATIPAFARAEGAALRFKPAFAESHLEQFAALSERKYDIVLGPPSQRTEITHYALPAGYEVESLPEGFEAEIDALSYRLSFRAEGSAITATREITWKANRIARAEYARFRAIADRATAVEKEEAVLRRKN